MIKLIVTVYLDITKASPVNLIDKINVTGDLTFLTVMQQDWFTHHLLTLVVLTTYKSFELVGFAIKEKISLLQKDLQN